MKTTQQDLRANAEGARDAHDVDQTDVALSTLNAADVRSVKGGQISQGFLREATGFAQLPDPVAELGQHSVIIHKPCRMPAVTTMGLQTMSSTRSGDGRSFLKWAGGKTRYADQIVALAPPSYGRYFEPFMGSAAVFFELGPATASLSDANGELVICFQQVAKNPEKIMALLDEMPNNREYYNEVRAQGVESLSEVERAARVIYLNKTGFRGLWRVNRKGIYNVPYGAYDRPYYNRSTLLNASSDLQGVDIRKRDFTEALTEAQAGDWVYLDPPYIPLGGFADFKRYTAEQFGGENDHIRLAGAMREAAGRGVNITMTNSDTPLTRTIFASFKMLRIATRRDINLRSERRGSWDLVFTTYEVPRRNGDGPENIALFDIQ